MRGQKTDLATASQLRSLQGVRLYVPGMERVIGGGNRELFIDPKRLTLRTEDNRVADSFCGSVRCGNTQWELLTRRVMGAGDILRDGSGRWSYGLTVLDTGGWIAAQRNSIDGACWRHHGA